MIVFDLNCENGHTFEGWFGSSSDFETQAERGLVTCPNCGSEKVTKALMAPAVPTKGNTRSESKVAKSAVTAGDLPPEVTEALDQLAKAQSKALKKSKWVGDKFAETSRAIHYGDQEETAIHGRASTEEAKQLVDEGISVTPLPFPIVPPEDLN